MVYPEILVNAELQRQFEINGYVKFPFPLLSSVAVKKLSDIYTANFEAHQSCKNFFRSTSDSDNSDLIRIVDKEIMNIFRLEASHHFKNLDFFLCNYLIKNSGEQTETPPHQDVTFVDESKYLSAGIWIPLQDVGVKEGNLFFVKGSHKFLSTLRVNPHYPWAYDNVKSLIKKCSVAVPLKAGEAVLFNHAIIHWAGANVSGKPRISVVVGTHTKGSPLYHFYMENMNGNNKIEQYAIDREGLIGLKKDQKPENLALIKTMSYDFPIISKPLFIKKVLETVHGYNRIKQMMAFI
jgi:hypothetical protein